MAIGYLLSAPLAIAKTHRVNTREKIIHAIQIAKPGDTIAIAPGTYRGSYFFENIQGTAKAPITITAQNPKAPPLFHGRFKTKEAIHLVACRYITLSHLHITQFTDNGINIDDGLPRQRSAIGIKLSHLKISKIGPRGNHDAIKLSGVKNFTLQNITITQWAGSGIDMVGCAQGSIDQMTFIGDPKYSPANAIQTKGGSRQISITRSFFKNTGHRAINLGGHTGKQFFRPLNATYEAKAITVAGNRFLGAQAPIAFASSTQCLVHHNTIINPQKWIIRILQDNTDQRILQCQNSTFSNNLVYYNAKVKTIVNVGRNTKPHTFTFKRNAWYQFNSLSIPTLPTVEIQGLYLVNPKIINPLTAHASIGSKDKRFIGIGAQYYQHKKEAQAHQPENQSEK